MQSQHEYILEHVAEHIHTDRTQALTTRVIAVVPARTSAWASAAGDGFAMLALETLQAGGTLSITIAFAGTGFQVCGIGIVGARQHQPGCAFGNNWRG